MIAVPDLCWTLKGDPIVSRDGSAFQRTFSGINTGVWDVQPPATGKHLEFAGVSYLKIHDGKIAYQGDDYEALGLPRQLWKARSLQIAAITDSQLSVR